MADEEPVSGTGDGGMGKHVPGFLSYGAGAMGLGMIAFGAMISTHIWGQWETKDLFIWGPFLLSFATGIQVGKYVGKQ